MTTPKDQNSTMKALQIEGNHGYVVKGLEPDPLTGAMGVRLLNPWDPGNPDQENQPWIPVADLNAITDEVDRLSLP